VLVGVDDFARRLIGTAATLVLPSRGDWLHQGDRAFALQVDGKVANLVSPVEGEVVAVNPDLASKNALVSDDPYGRGWVLQVKSPQLASNLRNLLSGRLARKWMEDSREALELRLMALAGSVLQDGGEPAANLGEHLPKADWERLVHEFLLS
jgi:glycine cleavage system H protein